jgi:hypothetical protein
LAIWRKTKLFLHGECARRRTLGTHSVVDRVQGDKLGRAFLRKFDRHGDLLYLRRFPLRASFFLPKSARPT